MLISLEIWLNQLLLSEGWVKTFTPKKVNFSKLESNFFFLSYKWTLFLDYLFKYYLSYFCFQYFSYLC